MFPSPHVTLETPMSDLPACCFADQYAPLAEQLYAAYNRGGDESTAGLNFQGNPCPAWDDLPPNVKAKWDAVALNAAALLAPVKLPDAADTAG